MPNDIDFYKIQAYLVDMNSYRAYEFRLYPTTTQQATLAAWFGQARFVYNYFLRVRTDFYAVHQGEKKQSLNLFDTVKQLTVLKKDPALNWLTESNAQSLQYSLRHLDTAYNNFFNKRGQFPTFKKKTSRQSLTVPQYFSLNTTAKTLTIPKMTPLSIVLHRPTEGNIKSVTIKRVPSGKYFAVLLCEVPTLIVKPKTEGWRLGIDLGLKSFLVTSDGHRVAPPQFLRHAERTLRLAQRRVSRRTKGGKNWQKAKHRVAIIHERIANKRKYFLHTISSSLVSKSQAIGLEDLNVKGMMANRHLAKSIADAGWSELVRQLTYKGEKAGCRIEKIDRFFPSSKRCHLCGYIHDGLTLNDREWECPECHVVLDRDLNAAKNIALFAMARKDCPRPQRPRRGGACKPLVEVGSHTL